MIKRNDISRFLQTPLKSLIPFSACCCSIHSCFFDAPPCFGCQDQTTCLCLRSNTRCCKVASKEELETAKRYCICQEGGTFIVIPRTCLKGQDQCFCLENRCAFPCDRDVPCLFTVCFITCFYNYKWQFEVLKSMGEIDPNIVIEDTPPAPTPNIVQHIHVIHEPQQNIHYASQADMVPAVPVEPSPSPPPPAAPVSAVPAATAPPPPPSGSAPPPPPPKAPNSDP